MNNVCRGDIGTLDYANLQNAKNPAEIILRAFKTNDMFISDRDTRLLIDCDGTLSEFDMHLISSEKDCTIICSQIIALDNAAEYARFSGIVFFFHTAENGHLYNPHIHAKCSEEEISIYLKDYRIIGSFKNKKKQRTAIDYVKTHSDEIKSEWNRIIKCSEGN
jgi:hypothetical protein